MQLIFISKNKGKKISEEGAKALLDESFISWFVDLFSEKLSGVKLEVREVMQSEVFQKQKLTRVLEMVNQQMNMQRWTKLKWSVDSEYINF